jgi:hypothetical protein
MLMERLSTERGAGAQQGSPGPRADHAALRDLLSEELLAAMPVEAWRKLFLGADYDSIRFTEETCTLLACDRPAAEWTEPDLRTLAVRFGGCLELAGERVVIAFATPRAGLEVAMLLQRTSPQRLRSALVTAPCVAATFEIEGQRRRFTLGQAASEAGTSADSTAPGTIYICASTWSALGAATLERLAQRALVTTEYQGDVVISASVTLAPPPRADLSTFAGLGRI